MDLIIQFLFREKLSTASVLLDASEYPCHLFIFLNDTALANEFGDVSIKTDGEQILPMKSTYNALMELRVALFDAIKNTQAFLDMKARLMQKRKRHLDINSI